MFGGLARRGLEAVISAFALLGFCCVPLGKHTALEHAKSVFSTPAAERALTELVETFTRVRSKLTFELMQFGHAVATPGTATGSSPERGQGATIERSRHGAEPKPRPPHFGSESSPHSVPSEPSKVRGASDAHAFDSSGNPELRPPMSGT